MQGSQSAVILYSEIGRHNSDLEGGTARIVEGGSWKRQRVVVVVPAGAQIESKVYLSHLNLIHPTNQAVSHVLVQGLEVGEAYSEGVRVALEHPAFRGWEYLLTLEHDNIPPPDGLLKLLARMEQHPELDCIGGLYWTKGELGVPQIWGDPSDPVPNARPQPPRIGELVECCMTGMGFNVWRLSMFRDARLRKPWFKTVSGVCTQDFYFWDDARKFGHRCAIDCDVLVGHYDGQTGIVW